MNAVTEIQSKEAGPVTSTDIIPSQALTPAAVFAEGAIDRLLSDIAGKARAQQPDVQTAKGRAAIASLANKVARSKTLLDDMGKQLVSEWKQKSSVVDAERRRVREFLDALKVEVRQPLTDYEAAEAERAAALQARVDAIREMAMGSFWSSAAVSERINEVRSIIIGDDFGELQGAAALAKDAALTHLDGALRQQQAQEEAEAERIAEQARVEEEHKAALARARVAQEAREKQEAADHAAREEEAARQRAENEARAAAERAERERQAEQRRAAELVEMQERAEAEAKRREQEAAERERLRIEREAAARAAEDARRAADQEHRRKINREALDAITKTGVSAEQAKAIVLAIVSGEIPHVSIRY